MNYNHTLEFSIKMMVWTIKFQVRKVLFILAVKYAVQPIFLFFLWLSALTGKPKLQGTFTPAERLIPWQWGSMRCYRRWELRFELCTSHRQLYFSLEDWRQCSEWLTFLHRSVAGSQLSSSLESDHNSWLFQHLILSFERQRLCMGQRMALLGAPGGSFEKSTPLLEPFWGELQQIESHPTSHEVRHPVHGLVLCEDEETMHMPAEVSARPSYYVSSDPWSLSSLKKKCWETMHSSV